jgi:hypothetical protein
MSEWVSDSIITDSGGGSNSGGSSANILVAIEILYSICNRCNNKALNWIQSSQSLNVAKPAVPCAFPPPLTLHRVCVCVCVCVVWSRLLKGGFTEFMDHGLVLSAYDASMGGGPPAICPYFAGVAEYAFRVKMSGEKTPHTASTDVHGHTAEVSIASYK